MYSSTCTIIKYIDIEATINSDDDADGNPDYVDDNNTLGMHYAADTGYNVESNVQIGDTLFAGSDYIDYTDLNEFNNGIKFYFPHPEWENNLGDNFTQDIRGNILEDQEDRTIEWNFNVESNASIVRLVSNGLSISNESISHFLITIVE